MRFMTFITAIAIAIPALAQETPEPPETIPFTDLPVQDMRENWRQLLLITDLECHFVASYLGDWTTQGVGSSSIPLMIGKTFQIRDIDTDAGTAVQVVGDKISSIPAVLTSTGITFLIWRAPTDDGLFPDFSSVEMTTVYPILMDSEFIATVSNHGSGYGIPSPFQAHALCG